MCMLYKSILCTQDTIASVHLLMQTTMSCIYQVVPALIHTHTHKHTNPGAWPLPTHTAHPWSVNIAQNWRQMSSINLSYLFHPKYTTFGKLCSNLDKRDSSLLSPFFTSNMKNFVFSISLHWQTQNQQGATCIQRSISYSNMTPKNWP